eukprot:GEZU01003017.1.p1 GENE.GEZU01003017.1~~GEZU01003017.1.p1  ORF type:complete len:775 (-),score=289.31 GEZU01003017.1:74-2398(-)
MMKEQGFERSTKKFWLKNESVDAFLAEVAKHLPVQIWNNRAASEITSVYFDDNFLTFYERRLLKQDGAELVRLRIYQGSEQVFVEKKVHYEEKPSTKRRFALARDDVDAFIEGSTEPLTRNGEQTDSEGGSASELYHDVQGLFKAYDMKPCIQTVYTRQAYQFPNDTGVRVTVDTNLRMGLMVGEKWHEVPSQFVNFPFAVVEIKLDGTVPEPEWLIELKQGQELTKVSDFSKYVHGCYSLISSETTKVRKWSPTWWAFADDQAASSEFKFVPLDDLSSRTFKKFCGLTQAIYVAVRLGIFDALHERPQTAEELSASLKTHPETTKVLLSFLKYFKLLTLNFQNQYVVTSKGDSLRSDVKNSKAKRALVCGEGYMNFGNDLLASLKQQPEQGQQQTTDSNNNNSDIAPSLHRRRQSSDFAGSALDIIDSIISWNNLSMNTHLQSFIVVQSVYAVTLLGIPDLIDQGYTKLPKLAELTKTNPSALKRLMRFLVKLGVFSLKDGRYSLTRLSERLLSNSSLKAYCLLCGNEYYRAWGNLYQSVKDGRSAFEATFDGKTLNEYLEENDTFARLHAADQGTKTKKASDPILRLYDHSRFKVLVDVGGGNGAHLAAALSRYPSLKGILLETPNVVSNHISKEALATVGSRCEVVSGDFFASVPAGGDLYFLKKILHCWTDEQAVKILKNVHAAMSADTTAASVSGKRLVVVDFMCKATDPDKFSVDALWSIVKGSRVRTQEQYASLFEQAGFKVNQVVGVNKDQYLFEAEVVVPSAGAE